MDRRALAERLRVKALLLQLKGWERTGLRDRTSRAFQRDLAVRTGNFATITWAGLPIWQSPLDLWTIQETIAELKPALLIETGTNRGGSAMFFAHVMDLLGKGRVVTIDILELHELEHARVDWIIGSSTDDAVVQQVRELAARADGPVMVILDGDHARDHVARELELYAPLVTPGSVLLSQDGIIDELEMFRDSRPGPRPANAAFLARHPEWEHDAERNARFGATQHPLGWLRRRA